MDPEKFREAIEYCRKSSSYRLTKSEMSYVDWALYQVIDIFKKTNNKEVFELSLEEYISFLLKMHMQQLRQLGRPLLRIIIAKETVQTIWCISHVHNWNLYGYIEKEKEQ